MAEFLLQLYISQTLAQKSSAPNGLYLESISLYKPGSRTWWIMKAPQSTIEHLQKSRRRREWNPNNYETISKDITFLCDALQTGKAICCDDRICPASAHLVGAERLAVMSRNISVAGDSCHRETHGPVLRSILCFWPGATAGIASGPDSSTKPSAERNQENAACSSVLKKFLFHICTGSLSPQLPISINNSLLVPEWLSCYNEVPPKMVYWCDLHFIQRQNSKSKIPTRRHTREQENSKTRGGSAESFQPSEYRPSENRYTNSMDEFKYNIHHQTCSHLLDYPIQGHCSHVSVLHSLK